MLSNDEQRKLDEIERAIRDDDPRFAATVTFAHARRHRTIGSGIGFLLGMVAMIVGAVAAQTLIVLGVIISLAGFLAMVASAWRMFDRPSARFTR